MRKLIYFGIEAMLALAENKGDRVIAGRLVYGTTADGNKGQGRCTPQAAHRQTCSPVSQAQQKPKEEPFRLRTSYGEIIDFD